MPGSHCMTLVTLHNEMCRQFINRLLQCAIGYALSRGYDRSEGGRFLSMIAHRLSEMV